LPIRQSEEAFVPVVHAADAVIHDMHGSRFTSYAAPSLGSQELAAWRIEVPPGSPGLPHTITREEVFYVLSGTLLVSIGDAPAAQSKPGDAIVVPPGATLNIENPGDEPALAWVTTTAGLEATLPDGSTISPPWVR
jgi:quercetin dioxygenase-like cupin family protein